jgi:hypothetical protein
MLKFRRRRRNEEAPQSNSGMLMNLSLFIMLLAFFIVLNSLSAYEESKVGDVVQSLEIAFAKDSRQEDIAPSVTAAPIKSVNEGSTFERIDALFESQISSYKKTVDSARGVMTIRLPLEKFSRAIMAAGQRDLTRMSAVRDPRGNFMIPTVVSVLKSDEKGAVYRMNILLHTPDNPPNYQNQNPSEMGALMQRASALTQKLEQGGFPQKLLNIGIKQGKPDMVELIFAPHIPFSPVTKEEALR